MHGHSQWLKIPKINSRRVPSLCTQGIVSQQKSNTHFRPSILPDGYLADVREHVMSQVFPSCQKSELEIKPFGSFFSYLFWKEAVWEVAADHLGEFHWYYKDYIVAGNIRGIFRYLVELE